MDGTVNIHAEDTMDSIPTKINGVIHPPAPSAFQILRCRCFEGHFYVTFLLRVIKIRYSKMHTFFEFKF